MYRFEPSQPMYSDLNDFLADLEKRKLLARISEAVSPDLEIAAVIDRVAKSPGGGPALLFEKPVGSSMPIAANLFGSMSRICLALSIDKLDDLGAEIEELTTPPMPKGFMDAIKLMPLVNRLTDLMPKTVKDGPCQEVVKMDGGLDELPVLRTWPEDGGPFITMPLVFTRDPETGMRNIGMYRMQCTTVARRACTGSGTRAARSITASRSGWASGSRSPSRSAPSRCCRTARPRRCRKDSTSCCSEVPVAEADRTGEDAVTVDLEVPASCRTSCSKAMSSPASGGARGRSAITPGCYSQPDDFPVFHITCITQRKKPTYLTTVVGVPPMEDFYLGLASERIFLPMIRKTLPEIQDMHFPAEGIFHNLVLVSIDKRYPGHARKIMNAFWGLGQLMFSKTIIVVDRDVDVHDLSQVAWIVGTHYDPLRDIQMTEGPVDDLDDASDLPAYGGKMGIDATRKWASEGYTRGFLAGARRHHRSRGKARRRDSLEDAPLRRFLRQATKLTALVFAPLTTTPTRSPSAGRYAPDRIAASAVHPPGSATSRSRSHSIRCACRIDSSVTNATRSMCACAMGNMSSPTRRARANRPRRCRWPRPPVSRLHRLGQRRCAFGFDGDDSRRRAVPRGDAADEPAAADRHEHGIELRRLL